MTIDPVEEIYHLLEEIEDNRASHNEKQNDSLFAKLVSATTGNTLARRLASQNIALLFKNFPNQQEAAYDALIDMIEDDDIMMRKQAISDLPKLCKDSTTFVPSVADILTQMLQTDDIQEQKLVNQSLIHTIKCNPLQAFRGIFGQLFHERTTNKARLRTLKLLAEHLASIKLSDYDQIYILHKVEAILYDVTEEEFLLCMKLLTALQCLKTALGKRRRFKIICDQIDLCSEFQAHDPACISRVNVCSKQALLLLSDDVNEIELVLYYLEKVIPAIKKVSHTNENRNACINLLRSFAELIGHSDTIYVATEPNFNTVLDLLVTEMEILYNDPQIIGEPVMKEYNLNVNFSVLECLLVAFYHLLDRSSSLMAICNARKQEFEKEIKYIVRMTNLYRQSLNYTQKLGSSLVNTDKCFKQLIGTMDTITLACKKILAFPLELPQKLLPSWQSDIPKSINRDYRNSSSQKRKINSFANDKRKHRRL